MDSDEFPCKHQQFVTIRTRRIRKRSLKSWALETRFAHGPGTYTATIRVRDGFGKVSLPVVFSFRANGA